MAETIVLKRPSRQSRKPISKKTSSVKLVNFESGEFVSILPNLGATVRELVLRHGQKLYSVLEFPLSSEETIENVHFAGVKLLPYPGRVTDATYSFGGKKHKLRVNSSGNFAIHGFMADKPYRLQTTKVGPRSASVTLTASHDGTTKGYPFKFEIRLTYTLTNGSFSCTTEIKNTDSKSLPIGDGWHPYFRTSGSAKRLILALPPHSVAEVTPSKVATGEMRKAITKSSRIPMSQKVLDSVFDFGTKRKRVTTKLIDTKMGLELQLWQESGKGKYRYLILYRPASGTSIAIEPWTCAPDAFNNKMGLIVLKPGGKFKASYGVELKKHRS